MTLGQSFSIPLVEKRQDDQPFGIEPVLIAHILRQGKIPLGIGHIADVETQCSKALITREKHLRLACFPRHFQCLIVTACREL